MQNIAVSARDIITEQGYIYMDENDSVKVY